MRRLLSCRGFGRRSASILRWGGMKEFLIALGWGLSVLTSFFGWGGLATGHAFRRAVARHAPNAQEPLELPAWGMLFSIAAGGALNLLGLANRHVIVAYVITGIAAAVLPARLIWQRRSIWVGALRDDLPASLMILL